MTLEFDLIVFTNTVGISIIEPGTGRGGGQMQGLLRRGYGGKMPPMRAWGRIFERGDFCLAGGFVN